MSCNNVLYVPRPTTVDGTCSIGGATGGITGSVAGCGGVDSNCCDKNRLSPRRNREKVREQIKDDILLMLGAPVVSVELDSQQVDHAIDKALGVFEEYAPREFYSYYVFATVPGKSVYEMPPEIGMVRNVFYKQTAQFAFSANDLGGAIPVEYFYPGGAYASMQGGLIDPVQPIWGRMGEWVLYKQYENMYSRISSNIGGWEWVGGYRHIKLYPIPCKPCGVIVHYLQKCKDWECATDAMKVGALAYAKQMLGRIRSRIKNPPGPNGGVQLDGLELLQEGKEELEKWREMLIYRWGDLLPITMG